MLLLPLDSLLSVHTYGVDIQQTTATPQGAQQLCLPDMLQALKNAGYTASKQAKRLSGTLGLRKLDYQLIDRCVAC